MSLEDKAAQGEKGQTTLAREAQAPDSHTPAGLRLFFPGPAVLNSRLHLVDLTELK